MSIYETTAGRAFTTDEQYYEFWGAPKTGVIYDWTRRRWVRCVMQAPKTPQDAVTPVDADAAIADEPWERPTTVQATHGSKRKAAANHAAMERVIVALMQQHGPLPMKRLMALTGKSRNFLQAHFDERLGTVYEYYAANGKKFAFGLPGQSYTYRDAMRHEHA